MMGAQRTVTHQDKPSDSFQSSCLTLRYYAGLATMRESRRSELAASVNQAVVGSSATSGVKIHRDRAKLAAMQAFSLGFGPINSKAALTGGFAAGSRWSF